MSSPYFSVIMPTYNRAERLLGTLEHILGQTFTDFELILFDDGGQDKTKELVGDLADSRIRYFWDQNAGPLRARAKACDEAQGQWLAFCDSDDLWHPVYLQTLSNIIETFSVKAIWSDYLVEGETSPRVKELVANGLLDKALIKKQNNYWLLDNLKFYTALMKVQPIMVSAFAINHSYYQEIGGIDRTLDVIGSEDAHLTMRACANAESVYINAPMVTMGRGHDNVSANFIRNLEGGTEIMQHFIDNSLIPPALHEVTKASIADHHLRIAKQYYWQRNYAAAQQHLNMLPRNFEYLTAAFKWHIKIKLRQLFNPAKKRNHDQ